MVFPIVIATVLGIVHVALWAHANGVAQAAADHGVEVAAAFGASDDDGIDAARAFVDQAGHVDLVAVTARRSAIDVSIVVRGTYPSVFGRLEVKAVATLVLERIGS